MQLQSCEVDGALEAVAEFFIQKGFNFPSK